MSTGEDSASPTPVPRPAPVVLQALLTVGIGAVVLVLGRLAMLIGFSGFSVSPAGVVNVFLDWGVLAWVVLVAVVTVWRSSDPASTRTRLYVVAAAIGGLVSLGALAIPMFAALGGAEMMILFVPQLTIRAGTVLVAGAIGALAAAGVLQSRAPIPRRVLTGTGIAALVIGGTLIPTLFWQFLDLYFTLFGAEVTVTEADGTRYLVTAAFAIALPIVAAVVGGILRVRSLLGWGIAVAILALLAAFVLQVPPGRFWVDPGGGPPINDDYVPCFGEGDPNCVGG